MSPYTHIKFDWLATDISASPSAAARSSGSERRSYLLPHGYGSGFVETLDLAPGMTMFRAEHRFHRSASGHTVQVGDIAVEMQEPAFQAQVMRGGRVLETQVDFSETLLLSAGVDLFRYAKSYRLVATVDCSADSQMTCLSIGQTTLRQLIGEEDADVLLRALDLSSLPTFRVRAIPLRISQHLHESMAGGLAGSARKLHCQARALDYLTALLQDVGQRGEQRPGNAENPGGRKRTERIHRVHEYLLAIEGKLPTLDAISREFGVSARVLNEDFTSEFGVSIPAFITNQRLMAAHELIRSSDVALKTIAHRLGYAHVNNFIIAFRKKFGYPPGALRRKDMSADSAPD